MEIKTKWNINDEVWYFSTSVNGVVKSKIIGISIDIKSYEEKKAGYGKDLIKTGNYKACEYHVIYTFKGSIAPFQKREDALFDTKQELIASL